MTEMRTLLFAGILYLIGVITVLFFRPAIMFNEKGEWKEFGTLSSDHTIFPFWMFCIIWAAVSYLICLALVSEHTVKGASVGVVAGLGASMYESEPPEDLVPTLPSKTKSKRQAATIKESMKPGYYMLDAKEMKRSGVPKYLYVGGKGAAPRPVAEPVVPAMSGGKAGKDDSDSDSESDSDKSNSSSDRGD